MRYLDYDKYCFITEVYFNTDILPRIAIEHVVMCGARLFDKVKEISGYKYIIGFEREVDALAFKLKYNESRVYRYEKGNEPVPKGATSLKAF